MDSQSCLKEIIENRKSIYPKNYSGKEVSQDILDQILASAQFAPNHKKTKPWRFTIISKENLPHLCQAIQSKYKETTPEHLFLQKKYDDFANKIGVTAAIIPIIVQYSDLVPKWEEIAAVAMAVQNMYLTCTANQVGCYWSSHPIFHQLKDYFNLQDNQECLGLFYIGDIS
ncbi:MAG: nitroreductase [Bacteroidetes bacterium]|jgi:nitroreductase|nr:nitroreductase [Bacteroidota bacterium]